MNNENANGHVANGGGNATTNGTSNGASKASSLSTESESTPPCYDAIVIGAGFGGIYLLHKLRNLGLNVLVLEAAPSMGGVWYWNSYPGARVDSDVPLYEFSEEVLWRDWAWTERFPGRDELVKYFDYVDQKLDLRRFIKFNTRVTRAVYADRKDGRNWTVYSDDGGKASPLAVSKFFLPCVGFAAKNYVPDIKGLDTFKGPCYHTSEWPQQGIDVRGKRVGIIGTGASGIQCIQEMQPQVEHLTVFQRTPNLCLPMKQSKLSHEQQVREKESYDEVFARRDNTFGGFHFGFIERDGTDDDEETRNKTLKGLYDGGGFRYWIGTYRDVFKSKRTNDMIYDFWRQQTLKRISDPKKAEILAPAVAPHPFGCKRPSLEQCFYERVCEPNVELVNLRQTPVREVTRTGVVTADGREHGPLDVLALATGFDAVTGGITEIDIRGIDSKLSLKQKWADGAKTYLGMAVADFPNMFFVYGTQSPCAFANGPSLVVTQGEFICNVIAHVNKHKMSSINALREDERAWAKRVQVEGDKTLLPLADSWYMGANIPGKLRQHLNYVEGMPKYLEDIAKSVQNGYSGFALA